MAGERDGTHGRAHHTRDAALTPRWRRVRRAGFAWRAGDRSRIAESPLPGVIDDGHAVHYTALERGTPVFSSDEVEVGTVEQVLDNYRENILDGIVMRDRDGTRRFVDAPEVRRTAERAVTLAITAAEAAELPAPKSRSPGAGRIARLFRAPR